MYLYVPRGRFFNIALSILSAVFAGLLASPVEANDSNRISRDTATLTAAEVFHLAEALGADGKLAAAETLLVGLTRDPSLDIRAEAGFRLARLRASMGNLQGSASALRRVLEEQPDATVVRLELARILSLMGEDGAASAQLRRVHSADLPPEIAEIVQRFSLALRSRRKTGASFEFGLAPDTNISRSTSKETVDTIIAPIYLDRDARARSGVGLHVSGQAFARIGDDSHLNFMVRGSGRAQLYKESKFNDVSLALALGPEITMRSAKIRPAVSINYRWVGNEIYSRSFGGGLNISFPFEKVDRLELNLNLLKSTHPNLKRQNGNIGSISLAYERALSPKTYMRVSTGISRQNAKSPIFSNTSAYADGLLSHDIGGFTVYGRVLRAQIKADEAISLFGARRNDRTLEFGGGIVAQRLKFRGMSPVLRVTRTKNDSPIDLYEYKRLRFEFALSKEF